MQALGLRLQDVSHRYEGRDDCTPHSISFALDPGQRALLVGRNGAGKTTLLYRIVGLLHGPGVIHVGSTHVAPENLHEIRRQVGFLWQNPDDALLLPTVLDDVAFGPCNDGIPAMQAVNIAEEWLERLGIGHLKHRPVNALSMGEKQLVSLAGVLARSPGILLLDEPAAYLDTEAREQLLAALTGLETTMLVVTHDAGQWAKLGETRQLLVSSGGKETDTNTPL